MKKIIVIFTLLCSVFSVAQTGNQKVGKILKELQEQQNSNTSTSFTFNKKTYKDKASFAETDKKTFLLEQVF